MLRSAIMAASRNRGIERVVSGAPVSRSVVHRFVGGADISAAVGAASSLVEQGLFVTLDFLGEDTTDVGRADAVATAYLRLMEALDQAGLTEMRDPQTSRSDVSVKLSALGQALPDGDAVALDHARQICAGARRVGATVTLDAEDHTTTDSTLSCAGTSRRPRRSSSRICAAPRATARIWPRTAFGFGFARAPTTSRHRWRSRPEPRSTGLTSGASTCSSPASATPCSLPTIRG
jgi:proline dehydrogenase